MCLCLVRRFEVYLEVLGGGNVEELGECWGLIGVGGGWRGCERILGECWGVLGSCERGFYNGMVI